MKLNELSENSKGRQVFWVRQKSSGVTAKGANYFSLVVGDSTLELNAKVWDSDNEKAEFVTGDFIVADFKCQIYNGQLQLTLGSIEIAGNTEYDQTEFFKTTKYDIDQMYTKLCEYARSVKTCCYHDALLSLFDDSEFERKFKQHPAAVSVHHAFVGGLLQHTFFVTRNAAALAKSYCADYDLCVTAAIFHDLGKMTEISCFPKVEMTVDGIGIGHVVLSSNAAYQSVIKSGATEEQALKLFHCILAHHGTKEWGSPVVPSCIEAMIVHVADLLDAKVEVMRETYEDDKSDGCVTEYNRILGTSLLKF